MLFSCGRHRVQDSPAVVPQLGKGVLSARKVPSLPLPLYSPRLTFGCIRSTTERLGVRGGGAGEGRGYPNQRRKAETLRGSRPGHWTTLSSLLPTVPARWQQLIYASFPPPRIGHREGCYLAGVARFIPREGRFVFLFLWGAVCRHRGAIYGPCSAATLQPSLLISLPTLKWLRYRRDVYLRGIYWEVSFLWAKSETPRN